jgi:DNA-binding transcriptional MerR regulator
MTALSYASEKNLLDPYLTQKTSGHLIAYRMIPYTLPEKWDIDKPNVEVPELNLTTAEIPGDIGFKGALVSKSTEFETPMKFMPDLYPINEIFEGINNISDAKSKSAKPGNIQGPISISYSRASSRNNLSNVGGATWDQRPQSSTDQFTDKWLVRLQDKYRRVFKLQEDVAKKNQGQIKETEDFRMAEERMYGRAANDLEILDNQTTKITEQLKEEGLSVSDVDEYMYALHAKERNAVISERTEGENTEGSGKSDEWADGILNSLSDEKKAKLEKVASTVREIQQNTRDKMVELGLETQETIDAFEEMFSDYVPLQGQARDEDSVEFSPYPSGGAGFSVSGATTKKAKGRKTESVDIVAQVISQNAAVSIKGRTNESMNALYNLVESNPNEDVWTILDKDKDGYKDLDPNIVSVRVNGVQKAIRFKDGSYAQSLRSMNLPQKNLFVKYMGTLNSWLRAAFTSRNPEFILSNFSRDIQSAIFNASAETDIEGGFLNGTGAMRRIFKMVTPSLKALIRDEVGAKSDPLIMRYYNEFKEDGGKTGWAYQKSLEDIASELEIDDRDWETI